MPDGGWGCIISFAAFTVQFIVIVVPDGGWGWIISCAAFTVQFIMLGLQNHLGLIHREHMEHFRESSLKTGIKLVGCAENENMSIQTPHPRLTF